MSPLDVSLFPARSPSSSDSEDEYEYNSRIRPRKCSSLNPMRGGILALVALVAHVPFALQNTRWANEILHEGILPIMLGVPRLAPPFLPMSPLVGYPQDHSALDFHLSVLATSHPLPLTLFLTVLPLSECLGEMALVPPLYSIRRVNTPFLWRDPDSSLGVFRRYA